MERHQAGETLQAIAKDMRLNYYTVRKWWRVYQGEGWQGLEPKPKGPLPVGLLGTFSPLIKYVALRLKKQRPGRGVDKLLLELFVGCAEQHQRPMINATNPSCPA